MKRVWELYADLLDYPNEFFLRDIHRLEDYLRGLGKTYPILEQLQQFEISMEKLSITKLQELYTVTFDLSPVCSPYIGFHLFGENFKRGSFMAMLREEFQHFGVPEGSEIPDHISKILRYCAVLSSHVQEREVFDELLTLIVIPGVEKMAASFADTENPYKFLIGSLSSWLAQQCDALVY